MCQVPSSNCFVRTPLPSSNWSSTLMPTAARYCCIASITVAVTWSG